MNDPAVHLGPKSEPDLWSPLRNPIPRYADGWWGIWTIEWSPAERAAWVEEIAARLRRAIQAAAAGEPFAWGEPADVGELDRDRP